MAEERYPHIVAAMGDPDYLDLHAVVDGEPLTRVQAKMDYGDESNLDTIIETPEKNYPTLLEALDALEQELAHHRYATYSYRCPKEDRKGEENG